MSIVEKLPCEVINAVLQQVGSLSDLLSALLTCRHVYSSFQENPHVAIEVVQRQIIPELLPYAVAVMEASHLDPRTPANVASLLDKLRGELHTKSKEELSGIMGRQLATIPVARLAQMSHTYGVIHGFVMSYAASAWELLKVDFCAWAHLAPDSPVHIVKDVSLSPKEYIRFFRAFYLTELYFRLFPRDDEAQSVDLEITDGSRFLHMFPPWELEQIGCVQDYLELVLSKASREVVAHDVYFGEWGVDYLTPGSDNLVRQTWLGQGVCFVHQLMTATTYDAKQRLLMSTITSEEATDLHNTLPCVYLNDDTVPDMWLIEYTREQREALFASWESYDGDRGPFDAWFTVNEAVHASLHHTVMIDHHAGFRERAYVLWDEDCLRRHRLLDVFVQERPESELDLESLQGDYKAMLASFDARSAIHQRGGLGYWSPEEGQSRIVMYGDPGYEDLRDR